MVLQRLLLPARLNEHDRFSWHWTASREYTSKSAYQAMFAGESAVVGVKELWKAKASNKCRFFIWLALLDRCWMTQRLLRHGLRSEDTCLLCSQDNETVNHLLCQCVFSREIWFKSLRRACWHLLSPTQLDTFIDWWLRVHKRVPKSRRPAFDSYIILIA
jgi:hypothetical protein